IAQKFPDHEHRAGPTGKLKQASSPPKSWQSGTVLEYVLYRLRCCRSLLSPIRHTYTSIILHAILRLPLTTPKPPPPPPPPPPLTYPHNRDAMISDTQLNSIAIFLGTLMMGLIVLYHFLAVNASDNSSDSAEKVGKGAKAVHAGHGGRAGAVGTK
ncbi:unnamed protein product, partial [Tuber aestivum]